MTKFALVATKSGKLGLYALLFSVLLVAGSFSYGDITREPVAGEEVITLAVENMT